MRVSLKIGKSKVAPLTSARFLAALYVILFHTAYDSGFSIPRWFKTFLSLGGASVSFFFVLSGYILATVYLVKEGPLDKKRFWMARFARVYPLFFVILVLDTPQILLDRVARYSWATSIWKTSVNFFLDVFLLQGWSQAFNAINFPSWSLSDEAFFYAIFPIVGVFVWKMRARSAAAFGMVLYLGTLALLLLLYRAGLKNDFAYNMPLLRSSEFILGIVAGKVHLSALRSERYRSALHRMALPLLLLCAALFCATCYAKLPIPSPILIGIFLAPLFVGIILALSSNPSVIGGLLSARLPVLLGEASFALYLIHIPLWQVFQAFGLGGVRSHYIGFLLTAIALSICSFIFFENAARRKILDYASAKDTEGTLRSSMAQ
ncbi:MAG: acyltransferase 3 [Acidobacteriaceae bacterium]|nr:acyltransferase 3 [Acidobacteriaceae bacterium]